MTLADAHRALDAQVYRRQSEPPTDYSRLDLALGLLLDLSRERDLAWEVGYDNTPNWGGYWCELTAPERNGCYRRGGWSDLAYGIGQTVLAFLAGERNDPYDY